MTNETVMWGLVIALLIAVALLTLLVIGLLRSYADIVKTLHDSGIRLGSEPAPPANHQPMAALSEREGTSFAGETIGGGSRSITVTGGDDLLLLAFLSSGCAACVDYWRALRSSGGELPNLNASVVVVTKGPDREEPGKLHELAGNSTLVVMSDQAWEDYDIPLTPHFVLIERSGGKIIGEGSAPDPEALADLMSRAAADARAISRRDLLTRTRGRA